MTLQLFATRTGLQRKAIDAHRTPISLTQVPSPTPRSPPRAGSWPLSMLPRAGTSSHAVLCLQMSKPVQDDLPELSSSLFLVFASLGFYH